MRRFAAEAAERRWNSSVDQSKRGLRFSAYDARAAGLRVEGTLRKIRKAYPHERGLVKETCACLVLLPLQLMSTHSQLIRTVCIDYCIPLVAPRIGFTVKARPNEPPRRKKPELDVPIRPPELWIPDVFSSFASRSAKREGGEGTDPRSILPPFNSRNCPRFPSRERVTIAISYRSSRIESTFNRNLLHFIAATVRRMFHESKLYAFYALT